MKAGHVARGPGDTGDPARVARGTGHGGTPGTLACFPGGGMRHAGLLPGGRHAARVRAGRDAQRSAGGGPLKAGDRVEYGTFGPHGGGRLGEIQRPGPNARPGRLPDHPAVTYPRRRLPADVVPGAGHVARGPAARHGGTGDPARRHAVARLPDPHVPGRASPPAGLTGALRTRPGRDRPAEVNDG